MMTHLSWPLLFIFAVHTHLMRAGVEAERLVDENIVSQNK